MFDVDTAGAINLTAKFNQDINITATGTGQVNIGGGVTVESVHTDGTVVVSTHAERVYVSLGTVGPYPGYGPLSDSTPGTLRYTATYPVLTNRGVL